MQVLLIAGNGDSCRRWRRALALRGLVFEHVTRPSRSPGLVPDLVIASLPLADLKDLNTLYPEAWILASVPKAEIERALIDVDDAVKLDACLFERMAHLAIAEKGRQFVRGFAQGVRRFALPVAFIDRNLCQLQVSESYARRVGQHASSLQGQPLVQLFDPCEAERLLAWIHKADGAPQSPAREQRWFHLHSGEALQLAICSDLPTRLRRRGMVLVLSERSLMPAELSAAPAHDGFFEVCAQSLQKLYQASQEGVAEPVSLETMCDELDGLKWLPPKAQLDQLTAYFLKSLQAPVQVPLEAPGFPEPGLNSPAKMMTAPWIILADVHPESRHAYGRRLRRGGVAVTAVDDGVQLLNAIDRCPPPALLVLDPELLRLGGRELSCALAETAPHVPLLLLSSGPHQNLSCFREAGLRVLGELQKPVLPGRLMITVQRILFGPMLDNPSTDSQAPSWASADLPALIKHR